jgi:hypothetical protein
MGDDKTALGVAVVALLVALGAIAYGAQLAGTATSASSKASKALVQANAAVEGVQTLAKRMATYDDLEALERRVAVNEKKITEGFGYLGGIRAFRVVARDGQFYPDNIIAFDKDIIKITLVNEMDTKQTFTIETFGGVNIEAEPGKTAKGQFVVQGFQAVNYYSVGDPNMKGQLVVIR